MEAQEGKSVVNALRHVDCEVLGGYDALCVESSEPRILASDHPVSGP